MPVARVSEAGGSIWDDKIKVRNMKQACLFRVYRSKPY